MCLCISLPIEVAWELQDGSGVRVGVSGCVVDEEKQERMPLPVEIGDATAHRREEKTGRESGEIAMLPLFLALASERADTIITREDRLFRPVSGREGSTIYRHEWTGHVRRRRYSRWACRPRMTRSPQVTAKCIPANLQALTAGVQRQH
jgi:hypothetical protein